jgi:RHS repeat-associated protein
MLPLLRWSVGALTLGWSILAWASSLWVTDGERLYVIDTLANRTVPVIVATPINALAATAEGGAWVIAERNLWRLEAQGTPRPPIDLVQLGMPEARLLAVDPYDATLWIAEANRLLHLDPQGTPIAAFGLPEAIRALALAQDQSVWVLGERRLENYSATGERVRTLDLGSLTESATRLAVDSIGSALWVAGPTHITRIDLAEGAQASPIASLGAIRDLVLEHKSGTLWVLTEDALASYDHQGVSGNRIGFEKPAPLNLSALALDPTDGTLWLGHAEGVRHVAADGTALPSPTLATPVRAIAAAPFWITPRLSLLEPATGSTTVNPQPTLKLGLDALCSGVPCGLPAAFSETFSLFASLDGQNVSQELARGPVPGQASFTPAQPLAEGAHRFGARAVDDFGHSSNRLEVDFSIANARDAGTSSASAIGTVTPKAANQPPTASWVSPSNGATFLPGSNITLSANASDSDGTVSKVDFLRGGSTVIGTVTTAPYTFVWTNVPAATYSLTARATDNKGATGTSSPAVTITVAVPSNNPPTVSITNPANGATLTAPANVTISASASDSDGTVSKIDFYDGAQLLGTVNGGAATLSGSATENNLSAGAHTLKAVATDNLGATGTATVNITVNAPPLVVFVDPAACSVWPAPASFQPAAEAVAPNGTISRVEFYQNNTLIGSTTDHIRDRYTLNSPWSNVAAGTYTVTAKAYDNAGLSTTSTPITITVTPPDIPPSVTLTAPAPGTLFKVGSTVTLTANATDSDGTISYVDFFVDGASVGHVTTASPPGTYTQTWTAAGIISHSLTARATDNAGLQTTSASVTISVVTDLPPIVTFTGPANGSSFRPDAPIQLTATASDPDGSISYVMFQTNNNQTTLGVAAAPPYTFSWLANPGIYSITAVAVDNQGLVTISAPITITVLIPSVAPVVSLDAPANNTVFPTPANVSLTASVTSPDGSTISKVEFYQGGTLIGTANGAPWAVSWTNVTTGTYTLTALAYNANGATGVSTPANITVGASGVPPGGTVDAPPSVVISAPANAAAFSPPATVGLAANAVASNGSIAKVEYYSNGTLIASVTTPPFGSTWSNVTTGSYKLTAIAYDNYGTAANSPPTYFTVGTPASVETITYLHNDFAGNAIAATDVAGAIVWKESYKPFGDRFINQPAEAGNRQGFAGKPLDTDTGLAYFGARYHDPALGRFMAMDPKGVDPRNTHSFNRYAYGNNNPYRFVDQDGRQAVAEIGVAFTIAGLTIYTLSPPALQAKEKQFVARLLSSLGNIIWNSNGSDAEEQTTAQPTSAGTGDSSTDTEGAGQPRRGEAGGPGAEKLFGEKTKDRIRERDDNKCVFCKKETTLEPGPDRSEIDHAQPKARGGNNTENNGQNTCRTCNRVKAAKTTEEHIRTLEGGGEAGGQSGGE